MTARLGPHEDKWHPDRCSNAWWAVSVGGALWPFHAALAVAAAVFALLNDNLSVLIPALVFTVVSFSEWRHEQARRHG